MNQTTDQTLFKTPFTPTYWRTAKKSAGALRNVAFAALMVAACMILQKFSIPVGENLKIT